MGRAGVIVIAIVPGQNAVAVGIVSHDASGIPCTSIGIVAVVCSEDTVAVGIGSIRTESSTRGCGVIAVIGSQHTVTVGVLSNCTQSHIVVVTVFLLWDTIAIGVYGRAGAGADGSDEHVVSLALCELCRCGVVEECGE